MPTIQFKHGPGELRIWLGANIEKGAEVFKHVAYHK